MSIRRAQDERIEGTPDGLTAVTEISDVPDTPVIGAVADLSTGSTASVAYTAATTGGTATTFTATSSPGGLTGTGASPITVSGLSTGVAYTFTVTASNSTGSSPASAASSSLTLAAIGKYESIGSVTVGAGGSSFVEFTSIPATYTHLQIRGIAKYTGTSDDRTPLRVEFNGDTGNNYARHLLGGNGTGSAGAFVDGVANTTARAGARLISSHSSYTNVFTTYIIDILDYKNTNKNTTVRTLGGFDSGYNQFQEIVLGSFLWRNTAAITTIKLLPGSDNLSQHSQFALYGIKGE